MSELILPPDVQEATNRTLFRPPPVFDETNSALCSAEGVIDASKKRAETKALEHFVKLLELNRNITWNLLDEDQIDVFEDRLAREIAGPNRLTLPPKTT